MTLLSHPMTLTLLSLHNKNHVSKFNVHDTPITLPLRLVLKIGGLDLFDFLHPKS